MRLIETVRCALLRASRRTGDRAASLLRRWSCSGRSWTRSWRVTDEHHRLGRLGERLARRHMEATGHRLMERNARIAGVEVDLLMLAPDEFTIVVVEVKTRTKFDTQRALPRDDQRRRLRRAADALRRRWPGRPVRGDVVLVLHDGRSAHVEHRPGETANSSAIRRRTMDQSLDVLAGRSTGDRG